jgi:hypothetical protein
LLSRMSAALTGCPGVWARRCTHFAAALTIATMPARTASGNSGQAAKTTAKSGSSGSELVALLVARPAREPTFAVASWRKRGLPLCDATPSQSEGLDVSWRLVASIDACTEKLEAAGIAPASRNPQGITQQGGCADTPAPCLHRACTDFRLHELVARWHTLASDVREGILRIACVQGDISRAGE